MQTLAEKPTHFGKLDSHKQQWLSIMGLAGDKSVVDCSPSEQRITVLIDGKPVIRQLVETWTRVMGYHRPTTSFNIGKKQEHVDRLHFGEKVV